MGLIIGVDFDGTVVEHDHPRIGAPVPGAIETLRHLVARGHRLILWTMRSGNSLDEAVAYMEAVGVDLWGVNTNPQQDWTDSPKAFCNIYIDDAAFGCPLLRPIGRRPYVNWSAVARGLL